MNDQKSWVVGIDPGIKGGIVAMTLDRSDIRVFKTPVTGNRVNPVGVRDIIEQLPGKTVFTVIEKASVMPNQGSVSGFTIGVNYSMYVAALMLMGLDFEEIRPAEWRKAIVGTITVKRKNVDENDIVQEKLKSDRKKNILKAQSILVAQRMFASVFDKISSDGPAEAALICEAARRIVVSGGMGAPSIEPRESIMEAIQRDAIAEAAPKRGRKKADPNLQAFKQRISEDDILEVAVA